MTVNRKLAGLALAIAITVIGVLAVGAPSASAQTVITTGSYPGSTTSALTYATYYLNGGSVITTGPRTIFPNQTYRNYDQNVCINARLWQLNTPGGGRQSWALIQQSGYRCTTIRAGTVGYNDYGTAFRPPLPLNGYSTDVQVVWRLMNGAVLGTRTYDQNATSDYRCTNANCWVQNSTIGANVIFNW